jgi:hypothetical protein
MKFEAPSQLRVRWLRSQISESSHGQTWLGRHNRSQRKKNTTRSAQKFNGSRHGVMALVEIQILHFLLWFFDIFLILYHLNRKHSNFHLNWTEGVAYRNYTIFSTKFKRASWLWVRCHRSWIWASSHGQTRLGRHIRSQRKKHHHTISTKGRWNSPRGQNTCRKPNFALFGRIFLIFFSDSVSRK